MDQLKLDANRTTSSTTDLLDGFKMTEIGELPSEWQATKPGELVAGTRNGDWGSPPDEEDDDLVTVRVLRGTDFPSAQEGSLVDAPIRRVQALSVAKRELEPGDVLIELSGGSKHQATGRASLIREELLERSDHPVLFTNFVKRLRVDTSRVNPEFFWRAWSHAYWQGRTKTYEKRTTGIRNFKYRDFVSNEVFLVPPLPEQRAIARVLRTVQEAIEATERVIEAAKELKRSMMEYLFTYGPVPVDQADQVELQDAEFRQMPQHWESYKLGDVARIVSGGTPSRKNPSFWEGGTIPWVKTAEVAYDTILDTGERITEKGLGNSSARMIPAGTLLVAMYGQGITRGRAAILGIDAAVN